MIYRIFVEKKENVQARKEAEDIGTLLGIFPSDFRLILRYDVEGLTEEELGASLGTVFSEPPVDNVYLEHMEFGKEYKVFAISYLTGQYDQRADSAAQCVQLLTKKSRPLVKCAKVYAVSGVTDAQLSAIKKHLINPVESEEVTLEKPVTLRREALQSADVATVNGFLNMTRYFSFFPSISASMQIEQALISSEMSRLSSFPSFFSFFAAIVARSIRQGYFSGLLPLSSSYSSRYNPYAFPTDLFSDVISIFFSSVANVVCRQ